MGKRKPSGLLNIEKAQNAGATFHATEKFFATTILANGFQKLIGYAQGEFIWTHKNFKD